MGIASSDWHVQIVGNWGHWFVQASTGYSDPTNFESLSTDVNGALLNPLRAEQAMTFETGLRHAQAEVILYHQTVGSAIVQVVEDDVESFINESDPLTMAGMEAAIQQDFEDTPCDALEHCRCMCATDCFTREVLSQMGTERSCVSPVHPSGRPTPSTHGTSGNVNTNGAFTHGFEVWVKPPLTDDGETLHPAYVVANLTAHGMHPTTSSL